MSSKRVSSVKLDKLIKILKGFGRVLIAYSGGVDSTFLLKVAEGVLKENVLAVTARSATYTQEELDFARGFAREHKIRHIVIQSRELEDKRFSRNPANRCYYCKKELFAKLKRIARREKIDYVADAANCDDSKDFRPGAIAAKEFCVRSPLKEAGFTKHDIRNYSKKLGLGTWNAPTQACLASRFPYGYKINVRDLKKVACAEKILKQAGFRQLRVRHYNGLCRIEVPKNDLRRLIGLRPLIVDKFKRLGYNYVTVDLEGYRSGSMNEEIKVTPHARAGNIRYRR